MNLGLTLGISIITIGLAFQTIGSILLLGGYAPQIFKLHKTKNPTGISVLFWTMIAIGCTTIGINMVIQDTPFETVFTQSLNAVLAWYTLGLVLYARKKNGIKIGFTRSKLVITLFLLVCVGLAMSISSASQIGHMLQTIGTMALLLAYLPQIWYLYKVKDASGISHWLFVVLGSGLLFVAVNMMINGTSTYIIVTEFINISLIFVQWIMTLYYQRKKK